VICTTEAIIGLLGYWKVGDTYNKQAQCPLLGTLRLFVISGPFHGLRVVLCKMA
jgi:hypothetical protein